MTDEQAKQDLHLIREMMEKSRRATAESGWLFIFWGIVIMAASAGSYLLHVLEKYEWIWANWIVFMGGGLAYSLFYSLKKQRNAGARTYAQSAALHFVMACGVGFMMVGLVFPFFKLYSPEVVPVLIALIAGMLVFGIAGVYESGILRWFGLLWWLGAAAMVPVQGDDRMLAFIPLMVVGYIVPGFIFRAKYRKAGVGRDA